MSVSHSTYISLLVWTEEEEEKETGDKNGGTNIKVDISV